MKKTPEALIIEGDGKTKRDEKDRPEERVGDAVGTVVDDFYQVRVCDLLLEKQTGQVSAQDHVQADGFGEQARANSGEQNEGKPLATLGAERQFETRVDDRAKQCRNGKETDDLAECNQDDDRLEAASRQQADDEAEEDESQQVVDDAAGDDDAGDPGIAQPEILETLQGYDDGRRRHRQADESGADPVESEQGGQSEAHAEGYDGANYGHAE